MYQPTLIYLVFIVLASLQGCTPDKTGLVPAFVTIDSLVPADTSGARVADFPGRAFPDVSLFLDGNDIGSYELGLPDAPGRMLQPVVGRRKLFIYGVVRADGKRSQRVSYPFYEPDTLTLTFLPDKRYALGTRILRESKFIARPIPLEEFFEDTTLVVNQGPYGTVKPRLVKDSINPDGSYWKRGGFLLLKSAPGKLPIIEIAAIKGILLPQRTSQPLYAELDYRSNTPITVGFYTPQNLASVDIILNPSPDGWKRAYVFLSDEAAAVPERTPLKLFIQGVFTDTSKVNFIALDNIRLMHLKPRL